MMIIRVRRCKNYFLKLKFLKIFIYFSKLSFERNLSAINSNFSLKFSARTISKLQASLQTCERKSPI